MHAIGRVLVTLHVRIPPCAMDVCAAPRPQAPGPLTSSASVDLCPCASHLGFGTGKSHHMPSFGDVDLMSFRALFNRVQVSIGKETCTIVGDGSTQKDVEARVKQIRNLVEATEQV